MPVFNNILAGSSGQSTGYDIDQSLRMGRTSKLEFTPSGDGNKQVATLSFWLKNCGVSDSGSTDNTRIFTAGNSGSDIIFYQIMNTSPTLQINAYRSGPGNGYWNHDPYYRDYSAWQHFVIAYNQGAITTYVNGEVVADTYTTSGTGWVGSVDTAFNSNGVLMKIGVDTSSASVKDIYLAEVHWVDGQNLSASSFGETDAATNQWKPIEATGLTYGTNGFYQKYSSTELAASFTDSAWGTARESFTSSTTWTVPAGVTSIDYLVVGGAGGGGGSKTGIGSGGAGGGGGSGGYRTGTLSVTPAADLTVTIGAGGAGGIRDTQGVDGGDSVLDSITSGGGGGGGKRGLAGTDGPVGGGSGGGCGGTVNGFVAGSTGAAYGNDGGSTTYGKSGGGGGGSAAVGANAPSNSAGGAGGAGTSNDISGSSVTYAVGGTGGFQDNHTNGADGTTNRGNGGGGGQGGGQIGGDGGSGFVAISYTSTTTARHTITANGDVANTRAQYKIGTSSIKFDGTGDYLNAGSSTDWDFGSGDFTIECWARASALPDQPRLFGDSGGNWYFRIGDSGGDKVISAYNGNWFGDNSQGTVSVDTWYHFAWSRESATNRFFFNGNLITAATITDASISTTNLYIGGGVASQDLDGYMDEIRVSDSARYTASFTPSTTAFTADANTKLLIHSDFDGGLGADSSGNKNDFAVTNLVATDQMIDTPTNNFSTMNPLAPQAHPMSEGNLWVSTSVAESSSNTFGMESGKWYFEVLPDSSSFTLGIVNDPNIRLDTTSTHVVCAFNNGGTVSTPNSTEGSDTFSSGGSGDIYGFAIDADTKTLDVYQNNTKVIEVTSFTIDAPYFFSVDRNSGITVTEKMNFGADSSFAGTVTAQGNGGDGEDFYYTPPSGYVALNTNNLPDPAIANPGKHFNTIAYQGNGTAISITGVGFQPDLVWAKNRTGTYATRDHKLFNVISGANNYLESNTSDAEASFGTGVSFDSDGFTLNGDYGTNPPSGTTTVAWNWKAGGTAVSNTDGSITSSVSANPTAGFSIVSYTGVYPLDPATIGHGLSQNPELVIIKRTDAGANWWVVGSDALTSWSYWVALNDTGAEGLAIFFENTAPTASVIELRNDGDASVNGNANTYIAYCFHSIEGYSKVGSYTGNGNADGTFVYTGFKPAWIMIKDYGASGDSWHMRDNKRSPINVVNDSLYANSSIAEVADNSSLDTDFVSNGFKFRNSDTNDNGSSNTYIYIAFAESPFKTSNAR